MGRYRRYRLDTHFTQGYTVGGVYIVALAEIIMAKKRKCGVCGQKGHNARSHNSTKKPKSDSKKYPTKEGGTRAGYLYVAYHPSFPGYAKIGSTKNLVTRASSFNTSYPDNKFEFKHYYWTSNRGPAESDAQKMAGEKYTKATGEWFKISCKEAGEIIKKIAKKYEQKKKSRKK